MSSKRSSNAYAEKIAYKQITIERRYQNEKVQGNPGAVRQLFSDIVLNAFESAPFYTMDCTQLR
jgi:signal transduction histidine kinase